MRRRQWEWQPWGWFVLVTLGGSSFGLGFFAHAIRFNGVDIWLGPLAITIQPPMPPTLGDQDWSVSTAECSPARSDTHPVPRPTSLDRADGNDSGNQGCIGRETEMPIHVTDNPDVHVTADELARYKDEYQRRFSMFAGKVPTLAQFIKREQERNTKTLGERVKVHNG